MKVSIDVDLTPEEMRRLIGLPDVQKFNDAVMEEMLTRLKAGTEGYDPLHFFRAGIMGNTDTWAKWTELFNPFGPKSNPS